MVEGPGRTVIGNYRVVAHGGSRERSRERANKNASFIGVEARGIFLGTGRGEEGEGELLRLTWGRE